MAFVRWIVGLMGLQLLKWSNPEQAAQVEKFLGNVKAQDTKAEETKAVIEAGEAKVIELARVEDDAGARQVSQEAAADATEKELNEALKPKTDGPSRSDDDELRHLSERL